MSGNVRQLPVNYMPGDDRGSSFVESLLVLAFIVAGSASGSGLVLYWFLQNYQTGFCEQVSRAAERAEIQRTAIPAPRFSIDTLAAAADMQPARGPAEAPCQDTDGVPVIDPNGETWCVLSIGGASVTAGGIHGD